MIQAKSIGALVAVTVALLSASSCQKEQSASGTNTNSSTTVKVKTYTEDVTTASQHSVITYLLSYDVNNRIISMVSAASAGDKFVYTYTSGTSYAMDIYNSNAVSIHAVYFVNSFSLVDSTFQYNDTHDSSTEKYLYNSSKQLIQLRSYDYSTAAGAVLTNTHDYTYDSNGNVIKDAEANAVTTYDFYPNLLNTSMFGPAYFYQNRNLPKTTTYTSGGSIQTFDHTYTFDNSNRLTSEKIAAANGEIAIKTYTY